MDEKWSDWIGQALSWDKTELPWGEKGEVAAWSKHEAYWWWLYPRAEARREISGESVAAAWSKVESPWADAALAWDKAEAEWWNAFPSASVLKRNPLE